MYICNNVIIPGSFMVESNSTCDFIRYHTVMLILFGCISVALMFSTICMILHHGSNPTAVQQQYVRSCANWSITTLLLTTGFEGPILLFYVIFTSMMVYVATVICYRMIRHGTVHVLNTPLQSMILENNQNNNNNNNNINAVNPLPLQETITTANNSCCICLDTTEDGAWFTTPCGHVFHRECIMKCPQNTCPLCRSVFR